MDATTAVGNFGNQANQQYYPSLLNYVKNSKTPALRFKEPETWLQLIYNKAPNPSTK